MQYTVRTAGTDQCDRRETEYFSQILRAIITQTEESGDHQKVFVEHRGGYMLDKDPKDISAGDILRTLEGDLTPIDCAAFTGDTSTCSGTKFCVTKTVWKRINDSVQQAVDSITLQELMEESIEIHTKYDQEER